MARAVGACRGGGVVAASTTSARLGMRCVLCVSRESGSGASLLPSDAPAHPRSRRQPCGEAARRPRTTCPPPGCGAGPQLWGPASPSHATEARGGILVPSPVLEYTIGHARNHSEELSARDEARLHCARGLLECSVWRATPVRRCLWGNHVCIPSITQASYPHVMQVESAPSAERSADRRRPRADSDAERGPTLDASSTGDLSAR